MVQKNLLTKQRLMDLENKLMVAGAKGYLRSLGKSCTHCCIQNGRPTRTSCITHGTRFNVTWQLGLGVRRGEGRCSEKTNACTCMAESFHRSPETITALLISCVLSGLSCPTLCNPMDCSPPDSSVSGDSPGKNTGVHCHALLQGNLIGGGGGGFCIAGRFFTS